MAYHKVENIERLITFFMRGLQRTRSLTEVAKRTRDEPGSAHSPKLNASSEDPSDTHAPMAGRAYWLLSQWGGCQGFVITDGDS
jgi:hypothetical protein